MSAGSPIDSGILAKLPGGAVAAGIHGLPTAGPTGPQELKAEVDAGWVGRVEITYRVTKFRHGKSVFYCWTGVHARTVDEGPGGQ